MKTHATVTVIDMDCVKILNSSCSNATFSAKFPWLAESTADEWIFVRSLQLYTKPVYCNKHSMKIVKLVKEQQFEVEVTLIMMPLVAVAPLAVSCSGGDFKLPTAVVVAVWELSRIFCEHVVQTTA